MGNGSLPPSGNIHDIRVPVPGTSASEFEVKDTGKKKKGEDKNINWNLQVWFTVVQIKRQKILPQLIDRVGGHNIFICRVLNIFSEPYYLLVVDYMYRLLKNSKYILDIMNSKHPLGCYLRGGGTVQKVISLHQQISVGLAAKILSCLPVLLLFVIMI